MVLLELFWSFLKIGFTSFGGLSMIPLINDEVISHGWMTASEVADIVAIAEMTPGPPGLQLRHLRGHSGGGHSRGHCRQPGGHVPHPHPVRRGRRVL